MSYKIDQLKFYLDNRLDLIPLYPWNKMIKGKERGKTPVHNEWTIKQYKKTEVKEWINKGLNLGLRIRENEIVIDLDPRNYVKKIDTPQLIADLLGYFDFDEILWELPVVKTGSGGYHIYFQLPDGVDYRSIRGKIDGIPGVDIKKKGGYVVAAGSRHPNGDYYSWENIAPIQTLKKSQLVRLTREVNEKKYTSGYAALNGTQLQELILDKLDVNEYDSNDRWFPIMCACHHATGGDGLEEFVEWSLGDSKYCADENQIRSRWESLHDDREYVNTIGTLIHELEQAGEETQNIKAILTFSSRDILETDDEDSEEADIIREAKKIASEIDLSDIYKDPDANDEMGIAGRAIEAINDLSPDPSDEDIARCLRLIKNSGVYEAAKATDLLSKKTHLPKGTIAKLLNDLESKIAEDLALLISRKTLEITFNKGKYLTCPPSGQLYAFNKTHWISISDNFMCKLVQNTIHELKDRIEIKSNELTLIQQATKLCAIESATLKDKLHTTDLPTPVINCKNGELWLDRDGSHKLKPHSYKSYLNSCLNVTYDPSATCDLFMETINQIFDNFPDRDDMVRHMGEILGYTIQPYKNIASWWLFRGPGGDGKSTILKILGGILNKAQLMSTIKLLSAGSTEGYNHATTSLVGKLAVVIEEVPAGYQIKDAGVKLLSENTKMESNPKQKDPFDFMYAGNLIMCSNGFPSTRDLSHGMFRRANIVPFNQRFDADGREDLDRASKILSNPKEMSGVLNFMLEGLERLRNRGRFLPPQSCVLAKSEWLEEANSVIRFLNETVIRGGLNEIVCEFGTLYDWHYSPWCQENEIDEKLRKRKAQFKRDLIGLGFVVKIGGQNKLKVYGGKLRCEKESDEDFDL